MANQEHLIVNISANTKGLQQGLQQAQGKLSAFSGKLKNIGSTLSKSVSLPLAIAGGAAIKMATDFNESLNKVDVAFGNSSNKVKDFAKTTLTQFGIAEGSALDMAALFGDMSTSMGLTQDTAADLSTSLVGLAGDLASFKNIQIEQATTALAGVFTGETESLKRLGIVMTQANLQQFAFNQGINKQVQDMSQAEKVLLRYNYVMSVTKNSQGDFARTQEGAANQMRIFSEGLKQLGSAIGQVMLPAFTKMVSFANQLIKSFINLSEPAKQIVVVLGLIGASAGPILYLAGTILPKLITGFTLLNGVVLANPITAIAAAVASLTAAFIEFLHQINPAITRIQTFFNFIKSGGDYTRFVSLQTKTYAANLKNQTKEQEKANTAINNGVSAYADMANELKKLMETGGAGGARGQVSAVSAITETSGFVKLKTAIEPVKFQIKEITDKMKVASEASTQLALSVSDTLMGAFMTLADGGNFFDSILQGLKKLLVRLVAAAAAAAVLSALLPGAAANLGGVKGIFSSLSGLQTFANGGIISGPTLGLMGEYSGARSNPEVVAPLDKLQGMIGQTGQNVNVGGEFRIQGQDLVVALQRAERNRKRIL